MRQPCDQPPAPANRSTRFTPASACYRSGEHEKDHTMHPNPQMAEIPSDERTLALILREFGVDVKDNLDRENRDRPFADPDMYWLMPKGVRRRVGEYVATNSVGFGGTLAAMLSALQRSRPVFPAVKAIGDVDWDAIARILDEGESRGASSD